MLKKRSLVIALLVSALALGSLTGHRMARAACEFKCKEVERFHTKQYAQDTTAKYYKMKGTDKCKRIWHTDNPDNNYAGIPGSTKKYVEIIAGTKVYTCFANGGVWAPIASVTNESLGTIETDIYCYDDCQVNLPMPGMP